MSLIDAQERPSAQQLKAAGVEGGLFYLYNWVPGQEKPYHDLGQAVGVIVEHDTTTHHPILDGAPGGRANAETDLPKLAKAGIPADGSIVLYMTGDTNVPQGAFPTAVAYEDAYRSLVGPEGYLTGIYGGGDLCDYSLIGGHAAKGWVTSASSWSHGHTSTKAQLQQIYGRTPIPGTDLDEYINGGSISSLGLWLPGHQPPPPPPAHKDDDMNMRFIYDADAHAANPTAPIPIFASATSGQWKRYMTSPAMVANYLTLWGNDPAIKVITAPATPGVAGDSVVEVAGGGGLLAWGMDAGTFGSIPAS